MMQWNLFGYLCLLALRQSHALPDCVQPPLECPNENITFWLYTRQTHSNPHQIYAADGSSIKSAPWVEDAPIKVLIHGYTGYKDSSPNTEIRPAYMQCCNYNIISVDYNPIARKPCYDKAVANSELVGKCTAQLIDSLVRHGFALSRFHVIGFSLGGHTAGFIGNFLTSGKLDRITGLDPDLPLDFESKDNNTILLDPSDSKFVDVLHTNIFMKGKLTVSGHVHFYANGGIMQPGCGVSDSESDNQSTDPVTENLYDLAPSECDHVRAAAYYAESINSKVGFYSKPCHSLFYYMLGRCGETSNQEEILFGEYVPYGKTGVYYFFTNSEPPYAKGSRNKKSASTASATKSKRDVTSTSLTS